MKRIEIRVVWPRPHFTVHVVNDTHVFNCGGWLWHTFETAERAAQGWVKVFETALGITVPVVVVDPQKSVPERCLKAIDVIQLPSVRARFLREPEQLPKDPVKRQERLAELDAAAARRRRHLDLLHLFNRDERGHEKDSANLVYPQEHRA